MTSGRAGLYLAVNDKGISRLGITVSKKVSKRAVERNRIKRLAREYYRRHRQDLEGFDLVFNAFPGLAALDNDEISARLDKLWQKALKKYARSR